MHPPQKKNYNLKKKDKQSIPGGPVAKTLCFQSQCRKHRFDPWSGKTLHATAKKVKILIIIIIIIIGLPWWSSD